LHQESYTQFEGGEKKSMTIQEIIQEYIRRRRPKWRRTREHLRRIVSYDEYLDCILISPSGKRFSSHQYRVPTAALEKAKQVLSDLEPRLKEIQSFGELHQFLKDTIGNISGIGELTLYDTALHLGYRFDLNPAVVFLHRGTRIGAKNMGLPHLKQVLTRAELPVAFRTLSCAEIEDVLCIYKDELSRGGASRKKSFCGVPPANCV
jgi:hypothetical protein